MSKGIKMLSAVDAQGTTHTVDDLQRRHDDGQAMPPLCCDSPRCGCAVRFVKRHSKNRQDRIDPIQVPAYIGLSRGSEHVLGCRYDAPGRLKLILAAASDPNFMHALDDGKRELRLLILHQGLKGHCPSGNSAVTAPTPAGGACSPQSTGYQPTALQLDSYLRTTTDLLALRAACENDALLAAQLTLRLGNNTVAWSDFFYESGRYDEVWERLAPGNHSEMPLALVGTIKSHGSPPQGASYATHYLNCTAQYNRTENPNQQEYIEVSVGHTDAAWLRGFAVGSEVVMFGLWRRGKTTTTRKAHPRNTTREMIYVTHKLSLTPVSKRQLAAVA